MRPSIKIVIVLTLVGLLAAVSIPNFIKARTTASMNTCQFNQMWIEKAKTQWALENQKSPEDIPTEAQVLEYMGKITPMWCGREFDAYSNPDQMPTCFLNHGKYILGAVGQRVGCPMTSEMQELGDRRGIHKWGLDWTDESFRWHYQ